MEPAESDLQVPQLRGEIGVGEFSVLGARVTRVGRGGLRVNVD